MQTDRTLQFWDTFHSENSQKEWISQPDSKEIFDLLIPRLYEMIMMKSRRRRRKRKQQQTTKNQQRNDDPFFRILEID